MMGGVGAVGAHLLGLDVHGANGDEEVETGDDVACVLHKLVAAGGARE